MLRIDDSVSIQKTKSSSFRGALIASTVMAFAGLGDALLYPLLPVYGKDMGFSVFFIGLLLSVNRFVRILMNTVIANMVNQLGMKKILIITSILATITTFLYGVKLGLIVFLIARILWGLSYAGLKIATLNYAAYSENKSGLAFGLSTSIKTLGAFLILWFGPMVITKYGIANGLFIVSLISSIGVVLVIYLPKYKGIKTDKVQTKETFKPSAINILVFMLSITIDGVLVVVLSYLLKDEYLNSNQLLAAVAFYLLLKRLFVLILSFVSGLITLKIPAIKLFNTAVLFCVIGLFLISAGFIIPGILLTFLFNPIIVTFSPLVVIERQQQEKNVLQAISSISTWWDFGAAMGAFIGIFLINAIGQQLLFFILSIFILILFTSYLIQNAKTDRKII
ncbi:MFS transporter [Aquimarina sp. 2201CG5-10]|uniref:MFS transporter n=1 Tax=Aquimarina callyspongiae TaxID=3098150 RepID=UPI002AB3B37E|nr:MFS transporter [Aquimarina sp. 2201CG5-10]MDY8134348.1 MFS transporter [Aquimarina sp. 2201CG5-10]